MESMDRPHDARWVLSHFLSFFLFFWWGGAGLELTT